MAVHCWFLFPFGAVGKKRHTTLEDSPSSVLEKINKWMCLPANTEMFALIRGHWIPRGQQWWTTRTSFFRNYISKIWTDSHWWAFVWPRGIPNLQWLFWTAICEIPLPIKGALIWLLDWRVHYAVYFFFPLFLWKETILNDVYF